MSQEEAAVDANWIEVLRRELDDSFKDTSGKSDGLESCEDGADDPA